MTPKYSKAHVTQEHFESPQMSIDRGDDPVLGYTPLSEIDNHSPSRHHYDKTYDSNQSYSSPRPPSRRPPQRKPTRGPPSKANRAKDQTRSAEILLRTSTTNLVQDERNSYKHPRNEMDEASENQQPNAGAGGNRSSPRLNKPDQIRRCREESTGDPVGNPTKRAKTTNHASDNRRDSGAKEPEPVAPVAPTKESAKRKADENIKEKEYLQENAKRDSKLTKTDLQRVTAKLRKDLWKAVQNQKVSLRNIDTLQDAVKGEQEKSQFLEKKLAAKKDLLEKALHENKVLQNKLDDEDSGRIHDGADPSHLQDLQDELVQVKAALRVELEEKEALEKKMKVAIKKTTAVAATKLAVNQEIEALVKTKAQSIVWSLVKFVQSEEEERNAIKLLVKHGQLPNNLVAKKQDRANFIATYIEICRKALFSRRNYVTSEFKKYYQKQWRANNPTLSVEDLVMCLKREVKTVEDMTKFKLYWTSYLPMQVGPAEWGKATKFYSTISRASRADNQDLLVITPDDEAFTVLLVHNAHARWQKEWEEEQANPKVAKDSDGNKKKKAKKGHEAGLFTSTTTGQNKFGGWNQQGLKIFKQYRKLNGEARESDLGQDVEKNCLLQLRKEQGIVSKSQAEHLKQQQALLRAKKRGEAPETVPTELKKVRTHYYIVDSDSDAENDAEYEDDDE